MEEKKTLSIGDLTARIPVIQGGMGVGISLSSLAGSVARCGAVGVLSAAQIGFRDPQWDQDPVETNLRVLREEIAKAREIAASNGIIGVNIMVATRYYERYVRAAVQAGADLIISGAGLPVELPAFVSGSGVKIAPIVSSLKSLQVISRYWKKKYDVLPDLVVIEGPLAGGHLGFKREELADIEALSYEEEIRRIIACVRDMEMGRHIPVAVAGGIYHAADSRPYFDLGADAVQAATRFVTTYECDADLRYKEAYIRARKEDIEIVSSPVGMPGRAIHNEFLDQVKDKGSLPVKKCHQCIEKCRQKDIPYCITDALVQAARGNVQQGLLFCGANAYRASGLEHVSDIMKEFEEELIWRQGL